MDYPSVHFYDSNDMLSFTLGTYSLSPAVEANIISDIKARMSGVAGVGTIYADKSVVTTTAV